MVTEEERELLRIQLKQELEKEESSQIAESATETVVSEVDKDITCSDNSNEEFGLPSIIDDPPSIERFELMKILVELEEQWKQEKPKVAPRQVSSPRIHSVPRPTSRLIGSVKSSVPNPSSLQGKGLSAQIKSSTVQSQSKSLNAQTKSPSKVKPSTTQNKLPTTQNRLPSIQSHLPDSSQQAGMKSRYLAASQTLPRTTKPTLISQKPVQEKNLTQNRSRSPQFSPVQNPRISLSTQFQPFDSS